MSKKNRNRVVENTNIQEGDAMGIVEEVEGTEIESAEAEGQPLAEVESTEDQSPAQSEESGDGIEDNAVVEEEAKTDSEPTQEEPAVDEKAEVVDEESDSKLKDDEVDAALKQEAIINESTVEQSNLVDTKAESKSIPSSFSKTVLLEILDSEVIVDASNATIYNTEEDMRAAAKLERIYETTVSLGVNHPISKVVSQALKICKNKC